MRKYRFFSTRCCGWWRERRDESRDEERERESAFRFLHCCTFQVALLVVALVACTSLLLIAH